MIVVQLYTKLLISAGAGDVGGTVVGDLGTVGADVAAGLLEHVELGLDGVLAVMFTKIPAKIFCTNIKTNNFAHLLSFSPQIIRGR